MKNDELDQIIEKSFKSKPQFHLSFNFADKVTVELVRREQWKSDLFEYLNIAGIIMFLFAVAVGTYYLVNKDLYTEALSYVRHNILRMGLILFLLNFILFADRVLLRWLFIRWNKNTGSIN